MFLSGASFLAVLFILATKYRVKWHLFFSAMSCHLQLYLLLFSYDAGDFWIRISIFIKLCQLQLAVFSNKYIFSQLYLMLNGVNSGY